MRAFVRVVAVTCVAAFACAQNPLRVDYPGLLQRLVDVDWLWRRIPPGERCVQWSSFDRGSLEGPGDATKWYANDDRGRYVRVVERDGVKEHVLVDAKGPGCVARIWSANPSGTLHFDVDGARVWSVDFAALCSGKVDGVPEPLAGMRSKGGNCYLPIPFQKSLEMSCTAGDLYYLVDVVHWANGAVVPSFTPELTGATRDVVPEPLAEGFRSKLGDGWRSADASCEAGVKDSCIRVPAGRSIYELSLGVRQVPAAARAELMERIVLVVRAGSEETVRVPVNAFFASGSHWSPWRGYLLGIGANGDAYAHWPMPFPDGGEVSLEVEGDLGGAKVSLCAYTKAFPLFQRSAFLFRASYHLVKGTAARPFTDHLVLDAKGEGRFVGCSLLVRNSSRIWWGEGDEKISVDGEAFPSWWGTGTEDYFGYAWCETALFQAPFHAQIECQGPLNFGFTQLHRTHVLDSIPFQQSLRFEFERWHWVETATMDYATVAYWYGAPGATSGLPRVPTVAERTLERLTEPPVWIADGVLEGEALRVVSCSGGVHVVQDTGMFEKVFSRDSLRWWRGGAAGDTLVLAVPVAAAGRYRVTAALANGDECAIVQCSLAGTALGAPFDGYAARVQSTGPRELGTVELPAGDTELRLSLTGKNPAAKDGMMVGVDYVRLEKIE